MGRAEQGRDECEVTVRADQHETDKLGRTWEVEWVQARLSQKGLIEYISV